MFAEELAERRSGDDLMDSSSSESSTSVSEQEEQRRPAEAEASQAFAAPATSALPSTLDRAIASMKEFAEGGGPVEQVQAARALRAAAREQRAAFPRAASVALLLSDALTFTSAQRASEAPRDPLRNAVALLTEPFIPQAQERELFEGLLATGWQVTASLDEAFVATVARDDA